MRAASRSSRSGPVRRGRETVGRVRRDTSSIAGAPRSLWLHRGIDERNGSKTDDNTGEFARNTETNIKRAEIYK